MTSFPRLFSPIRLRNTEIRNRILSTGPLRQYLAKGGLPGEDFVAYHEARAKGGAGPLIVEAARFHAMGFTDSPEPHVRPTIAFPVQTPSPTASIGMVRKSSARSRIPGG